ncbi:hypothetical protein CMO83_02825 [Candidatus Woesearchaeota archaeon]|jgi:hypothetical protein|nr:hypothetical protein [Candidatus Woesearchaeota archaeon]|tara:strand:- start:1791 stop:2303 length:513 start_codon:yes stop_codon:yes gene_type:complete
MSEKKQVLYDLRTSYNGPFVVEDFYAEVDNWIKEKGYDKEPKRKVEQVTKTGKKMQWVIEVHIHLDDLHHGVIVLRALLDNVKEIVIKKKGKKIRINKGSVFINIDGFIESHIHGSFFQIKPVLYFFRALIDRFIYNFWSDKYNAAVDSDGRELFKRISSFFNLQKYKFQ